MTGCALLFSLMSIADPLDDSLRLTASEEAQVINQLNLRLDSADKKLKFRSGTFSLADGRIRLQVPDDLRFINGGQSRFVLEQLWGNSPDSSVIGMIVSRKFSVNRSAHDFSFVIGYNEIGHVPDADVSKIDFPSLLSQLQQHMDAANDNRKQFGYNTMKVTGWAGEPTYDAKQNMLTWATEISVSGTEERILNYEVRLLGRSGVITISAVATMDQLARVKELLPRIVEEIQFESGFAYSDFKPERETEGTWKLEDLVTGKDPEYAGKTMSTSRKVVFSLGGLALAAGFAFSISKRKGRSKQA
jgi:uncharacterized membrane-anchored protein